MQLGGTPWQLAARCPCHCSPTRSYLALVSRDKHHTFLLHPCLQLGEHLRQLGVPVPGSGELQLPLPLPAGLPPGLLPAAFLPPGASGAATPPALPPLSGAPAAAASPQQKKGAAGPPIDVRIAMSRCAVAGLLPAGCLAHVGIAPCMVHTQSRLLCFAAGKGAVWRVCAACGQGTVVDNSPLCTRCRILPAALPPPCSSCHVRQPDHPQVMGLLADIRSKPAEPGAAPASGAATSAAAAAATAAPPPMPAGAAAATATPSTTPAALPAMASPPPQPVAAAPEPVQVRLDRLARLSRSGLVALALKSSR